MLNLDYSNLLEIVKPYKKTGRTESAAFLHWFLVNIYRLEQMEVDNIICDGQGDNGIDGIYINDNEGCLTLPSLSYAITRDSCFAWQLLDRTKLIVKPPHLAIHKPFLYILRAVRPQERPRCFKINADARSRDISALQYWHICCL